MDWIKPVKEIFRRFSADKSPLPIVQVNGQKGETGSPFIVKPAASKDRLPGLIVSHIVHDQEKNISPPSVICLQKHRDSQQCQHADKLHFLIIPEVFQGTECQVSQKQGEKYILFFISPGVGKHEVPWNLRDTCK